MHDNFDFITMNREPSNLKEVIYNLFRNAQRVGNSRISSKIGEIKGLYSAYELCESKEILEAICKKMGEIIQDLISFDSRSVLVRHVPMGRRLLSVKEDWYVEFEDFLCSLTDDEGNEELSPTTISLYLRALRRIINDPELGVSDFDSLYSNVDSLIRRYSEMESKKFEIIAVLKYFKTFAEIFYHGRRDTFRVVIIIDGIEKVLWRCFCSEIYAIEKFKRLLRKIVNDRRSYNTDSRWNPVRLYDNNNNIIRQEG